MNWWDWGWTVPIHQSFGDNPIIDYIRVVVVILGIMLVFQIARVLYEQNRRVENMDDGQILRFIGLMAGDLYVALTELSVMGTPATPRLVAGIILEAASLIGVRKMRRQQRTQTIRQ